MNQQGRELDARFYDNNMWRRLWDSPLIREFFLLVVATVAVQLALGLGDLLSMLETAQSWGDIILSFTSWFNAFSFALAITLIKQALVWAVQKLAGVKSVTVKGIPEPPIQGPIV